VEKLFSKLHTTMPNIVGIIHAAMVLDDTIIANLDADRFRGVFRSKVTGARNLDFVARGLRLDYFVLFSSVTTLFGNPGQGNYVAANAYMEGLARRRRQLGLAPSQSAGAPSPTSGSSREMNGCKAVWRSSPASQECGRGKRWT
jgi:phthiocerol/phenolphthiocerol synthesis type-I polyketide synthase C